MKFYSQYGQDEFIDKFLNQKTNGVFVDIGAFDGISLSNTYFFEKERNWNGICVEPQKEYYEKLIKNRNSICYNRCVYSDTRMVQFWNVCGPSAMLSGIENNLDERHKERINRELIQYGGKLVIEEMQTISFNDMLCENNIKKVDYCSIDTEGSELILLKSIDFNEFDISCFSIEGNYGFSDIDELMISKGYIILQQLSIEEKIYLKS
jgi:FkbM family methyltransferase